MRIPPWKAILVIALLPAMCEAEEGWPAVLSRMRLRPPVSRLTRTNCVHSMLAAFESNSVVKALIFMPGATDEFYMFRRAQAELPMNSPTLFDAVAALTNQTRIRATFKEPFLLLHTRTDPLDVQTTVRYEAGCQKLKNQRRLSHVQFNDTEWDAIQPLLKKKLRMDVRPWRYSSDSYHFYRSALAGWNLTDWEMLEAVALASQTGFAIEKQSLLGYGEALIRFENDSRAGPGRQAGQSL